jgi:hypothetical protein
MPGKTPGRRRASPPRSPTPLEGSRRRSGIWVKERCHGKRYCRQRTDPVAFRAWKTIASLSNEQGTHRSPSSQDWAGRRRQMLVVRDRRASTISRTAASGRASGSSCGGRLTGKRTVRNTLRVQVFADKRCTAAILDFLAATEVGLRDRRLQQAVEEADGGGEETRNEEDDDGGGWP